MALTSIARISAIAGMDGITFSKVLEREGLGSARDKIPTQEGIDLGLAVKAPQGHWTWDSDKLIGELRTRKAIPATSREAAIQRHEVYLNSQYGEMLDPLLPDQDRERGVNVLVGRTIHFALFEGIGSWTGLLDDTAPTALFAALTVLRKHGAEKYSDTLIQRVLEQRNEPNHHAAA